MSRNKLLAYAVALSATTGVPIKTKTKRKDKYIMQKILLADNGHGRGLFFAPDNNQKFVVATIEDNNGIGNIVESWHWGKYFNTLEEAFKEYSK